MIEAIVTCNWLSTHLKEDTLILLDASQHFNLQKTISGAQHFDIKNTFSDPSSAFPNTFPTISQFTEECRKLGIRTDSQIVVFDNKGIFTSPRVWLMFKAFGFNNIAVLDGGLPAWTAQQLPVGNTTAVRYDLGNVEFSLDNTMITSYTTVLANRETNDYQLIDARSRGRFQGTAPEPRAHLCSGHIKNSINLPYTEVLDNGKFKSTEALKKIFDKLDLEKKKIIFSCGSGITACIILLAHHLVYDTASSIYDGSWTEWAEKQGLFM